MRRMRLGDKSIERDAARLRALLGPGGAAAGGNFPQWVMPTRGRNFTDSTYIDFAVLGSVMLLEFPADKISIGYAGFLTPSGYSGTITIYSVFRPGAGETIKARTSIVECRTPIQAGDWVALGTGGETTDEVIVGTAPVRYIAAAGHSYAITGQSFIELQGIRRGTDIEDTSSATAYFVGWWIVYG